MHNGGSAEISTIPTALSRVGFNRERRPLGEIRAERLAEILKGELLPRLLSGARASSRSERSQGVLRADPETLALTLISGRLARAQAAMTARLRSGATARNVMFEDLAPAARKLGELWCSDACDFFDVAVATHAIRDMLLNLVPTDLDVRHVEAGSLLIAPAPGEIHELGADMVAAMFRFAGWRTVRGESGNVCSSLAREWFDVVGFSLSCDRHIESLRSVIRAVREVSRNRKITVLVGGPAFAARPGLGGRLGADVCAPAGDIAAGFPDAIPRVKQL
jgi:methanogenic corrinoid protein MtbC1